MDRCECRDCGTDIAECPIHLDWGRERRWCYPRDGACWSPEAAPIGACQDWIELHGVRTFTSPVTGTAAIEAGRSVTIRVGAITWLREMVDWPGHTRLVAGDLGMDVWESPDLVMAALRKLSRRAFVAVGPEKEGLKGV